jgi:hypothetical protein
MHFLLDLIAAGPYGVQAAICGLAHLFSETSAWAPSAIGTLKGGVSI